MPRALCWRCDKYVNAVSSGSDIMGGVVLPGPLFNAILPIRKRYQEYFCPVCGTSVITDNQRAELAPKRQPILTPTTGVILIAVIITFTAFNLIRIVKDRIQAPDWITEFARVGYEKDWNAMSSKQKHQICAKLALASSKGDSEQAYYDALNESSTDQVHPVWVIIRNIDPGNRVLPGNQR